jgi:hypothetical protein
LPGFSGDDALLGGTVIRMDDYTSDRGAKAAKRKEKRENPKRT